MKENTSNKGVTATWRDIAATLGLQDIKEELTNVIELMGPNTPHLSSTTSKENDEFLTTSIYSSVVEVKATSRKENQISKLISADTPRDISEMSALPIDISDPTNTENTNLNFNHNVDQCPYREYINVINNFSQNAKPSQKFQTYEKLNLQKIIGVNKNKERFSFLNLLKFRRQERDASKEPLELYRINIQQDDNQNIPNKLTFDLIHDIPKPDMTTVATNTSKLLINSPMNYPRVIQSSQPVQGPSVHSAQVDANIKSQSARQGFLKDNPTRVDVYYFDHGNSCYLKTTDVVPNLASELIAEKTEAYTTKFWAEIFGTIHIFFAFATTFILQLLKFLLQSLVRPLTIGLLQLTSDYFFKPCLTVIFNAVIQPPAIFFFNILTSLRDLCDPIAEGIGYFLREVANVCRSIRLIAVKSNNNNPKINKVPLRRFRIRRKK